MSASFHVVEIRAANRHEARTRLEADYGPDVEVSHDIQLDSEIV